MSFSGPAGVGRLFDDLMGGQASWLLPASVIALIAGLWITRRAPRTDRTRAGLLLWGGWLIVTAIVFSYSTGVIHTYYTVALAPAIAALTAIGGRLLYDRRESAAARALAAAAVAHTAGWGWVLWTASRLDALAALPDPMAATRALAGLAVCAMRAQLARRLAATPPRSR